MRNPIFVFLIVVISSASATAAAPNGRYLVDNDIVKDVKTGLVWQRNLSTDKYTWENAKNYCQKLDLGGSYSSGWRLPQIKELLTLVDVRSAEPSIDVVAFPNTPLEWFWTLTACAGDASRAWGVHHRYGRVDTSLKTEIYRVRCVR